MFKEVGKLREEKQNLQREIADLMAVSETLPTSLLGPDCTLHC